MMKRYAFLRLHARGFWFLLVLSWELCITRETVHIRIDTCFSLLRVVFHDEEFLTLKAALSASYSI